MKKKLLLFYAILLCFTSTFAQIYVAKNGSDGNPATLATPYLTIQQAANVARLGDMVMLRVVTYPFCFELLTNY